MKKWFLDTFSVEGKFDMDKAREEINDYVIAVAKTAAIKVVSGQSEQETEKKAEIININEAPALADVV